MPASAPVDKPLLPEELDDDPDELAWAAAAEPEAEPEAVGDAELPAAAVLVLDVWAEVCAGED